MDIKKCTYRELEDKRNQLQIKRDEIMNDCAKNNLSFSEFMEKAKDISEEIFLISREMRLKQTPVLEYGKKWRGELYMLEKFIELCEKRVFIDDDGYGYYATNNSKSDIIIYPSDIEANEYRKDFTHIIWFNK